MVGLCWIESLRTSENGREGSSNTDPHNVDISPPQAAQVSRHSTIRRSPWQQQETSESTWASQCFFLLFGF